MREKWAVVPPRVTKIKFCLLHKIDINVNNTYTKQHKKGKNTNDTYTKRKLSSL